MEAAGRAPGAIPEIVAKAFRVARLEKPGPTHIELPEDIAATEVAATLDALGPAPAPPNPPTRGSSAPRT